MGNFTESCDDVEGVESSDVLKIVALTVLIGVCLTSFVLGSLFLWRRSRFANLKARRMYALGGIIIGSIYQLVVVLDILADGRGIPCFLLSHSLTALCFPIVSVSVAETIRFYFTMKLSHALSDFEVKSALSFCVDKRLNDIQTLKRNTRVKSLENLKSFEDSEDPIINRSFSTKTFLCCLIKRSKNRVQNLDVSSRSRAPVFANTRKYMLSESDFPPEYLFFLSSSTFSNVLVALSIICSGLLLLLSFLRHGTCVSPCDGFEFEIRLIGGTCLFFSSIGGSFAYKIKDSPDPFNLKYDILLGVFVGVFLGLSGNILFEVNPYELQPATQYRMIAAWVLIGWAQIVISLGRPLWHSHKQSKLQGGIQDVTLDDVLKTATGRNMFKAFLVTEFSVENYLFWREAVNYKKHFHSRTQDENEFLRILIAKTFLGEDAKLQVNVSDKTVQAIQMILPQPAQCDDFQTAGVAVYQMMSNDSFIRFRQTHNYKSILGEDLAAELM